MSLGHNNETRIVRRKAIPNICVNMQWVTNLADILQVQTNQIEFSQKKNKKSIKVLSIASNKLSQA